MIRPQLFPDPGTGTPDLADLDRSAFSDDADTGAGIGRNRADVDLGARSDAFQAALRRHEPDDAALAAGAGLPQPLPSPVLSPPTAAPEPVEPSPRLLAVVEACARALATELHLRAGGPVAIELKPEADAGDDGLGLVRVILETDRLRVEVAAVAGAAAQAGLVDAARTLADRLARRFPRRQIEVAELPALPPGGGR